jgi:transcriptional regulator with XRE-family HTH domain
LPLGYRFKVPKQSFEPTYLRAYRLKKGLSLRRLAARMESEPGVQLISHAQLGRIETGQQPYNQPILEAAAQAMGISVYMIMEVHPDKEGDVIDLLSRLKGDTRAEAVNYLRFLASK